MNITKLRIWSWDTIDSDFSVINDPSGTADELLTGFFNGTTRVSPLVALTGGSQSPHSFYGSGITSGSLVGGFFVIRGNTTDLTLDTPVQNVTSLKFKSSLSGTSNAVLVLALDENDCVVGWGQTGNFDDNYIVTVEETASATRLAKIRLTATSDIVGDAVIVPSTQLAGSGLKAYSAILSDVISTSTIDVLPNNFNGSHVPTSVTTSVDTQDAFFWASGTIPAGTYREFDLDPSQHCVIEQAVITLGNSLPDGVRLELLSAEGLPICVYDSSSIDDAGTAVTLYYVPGDWHLDVYSSFWPNFVVNQPANVGLSPSSKINGFDAFLMQNGALVLTCVFSIPTSLKFTVYDGRTQRIVDQQVVTGTEIRYEYKAPVAGDYLVICTTPSGIAFDGMSAVGIDAFTEVVDLVYSYTPSNPVVAPDASPIELPFYGSITDVITDNYDGQFKWYTFTVTGVDVPLTLEWADSYRPLRVGLFSANGTLISESGFSNGGSPTGFSATVQAGTYYVVCTSYSNWSVFGDGFYFLSGGPMNNGLGEILKISYPLKHTVLPSESGNIFAGFSNGTFTFDCIAHTFDDTFRCRVFNQDGSTVTLQATYGPAQGNTSLPNTVDQSINGGFRSANSFMSSITLTTENSWVDVVYDKRAKAFQIAGTGQSSPWSGAVVLTGNNMGVTPGYGGSELRFVSYYGTVTKLYGGLASTVDPRFILTVPRYYSYYRMKASQAGLYRVSFTLSLLRTAGAVETAKPEALSVHLIRSGYPDYESVVLTGANVVDGTTDTVQRVSFSGNGVLKVKTGDEIFLRAQWPGYFNSSGYDVEFMSIALDEISGESVLPAINMF